MKIRGLTVRLAMLMVVGTLLMQLAHGVYRLTVDIPNARKQGVDELNHLVNSLKPALSWALYQVDQQLSDEILKTFRSYEEVSGVWLLDEQQEGVGVWVSQNATESNELREVTWPITYQDQEIGFLVLMVDMTLLDDKALGRFWNIIGYSILMGALTLLLLYIIAQKLVAQPIMALAKSVNAINVKSFKKEDVNAIDSIPTQDEVMSLRNSIVAILSELAEHLGDNQQAMILLQEFNESLEEQVKLRTQELEQAKETAEVANNAKTDFLNVMTHELRTPLNGVLGFSAILKNRNLEEKDKQLIDGIEQAGQGLLVMLSDIIDFVELDSKPLGCQVFSVHDAVSSIYNEFLSKAQAKNLELNFNVDNRLILKGDPRRLNIVVRHLVSNGIKFTEQGSVQLDVYEAEDGDVMFCVADTGIGIEEQVFEKFKKGMFNQKEQGLARSNEGLGLGIAIVNRICRKWQGQWWFEKNQPQGVIVKVKLGNL